MSSLPFGAQNPRHPRPSSRISRFMHELSAGRAQDALLAIMAVAVISLMVLPLPPALLDLLISVNIGLSVMLLMLSLYVSTPLGLSTFPTLLLFTTLLRLSLNIASTRAILLNADAGRIIETFGKLVVGGSVIVGVVVFLIIAIVQFIVIAKGAERVAEVGARFTLDALPGKQMSIDAELRAGILDKDEARANRATLQRESQLYGAMDGAMKFVKGDAIAGLLIALVNILAGISVGVGVHGMALADAASIYSILTVGDGLVSQIPSLFVSLAAGVLITRVSGAESETPPSLGSQIGQQIGAQPKALFVTAAVLALFMLVPGFPKVQFLVWSGLFMVGGFALQRAARRRVTWDPMTPAALHRDGIMRARSSTELESELVASYALTLRLSPTLAGLVAHAAPHQSRSRSDYHPIANANAPDSALAREIAHARETVTRRLGVPFPGIGIVIDERLPADHFAILVNEVPVAAALATIDNERDGLAQDHHNSTGRHGFAANADDSSVGTHESDRGARGLSLTATLADGTAALAPSIGRALRGVLAVHAHEFVGLQETKVLLAQAQRAFPDLVAEATRIVPLPRIAEVLRRLVEEGVAIRNLRDILQALIEWSPKEKEPIGLTELVRTHLKSQITYQVGGASRTVYAVTLSREIEEIVRAGIRSSPAGSFIDLAPALMDAFADGVAARLGAARSRAPVPPVILVSMDIRRYVRQLVASQLPDTAVVSYQSLTDDAQIKPMGELRDLGGSETASGESVPTLQVDGTSHDSHSSLQGRAQAIANDTD